MNLSDKEHLRAALRLAGLSPQKKLGQHFLVDETALSQIVAAAHLQTDDTVLEIGPGPGVLTERLTASGANVIAVETDEHFARILGAWGKPNLTIAYEDFRKFNLNHVPTPYKVVANLPYNITSLILQRLFDAETRPTSITILVQKEVAERICARPGQYSILAVMVQLYGAPEIVANVAASSFYPRPKVDSAILHIQVYEQPVLDVEPDAFFRLVKIGFSAKRKMLKNNLASGLKISTQEAQKLVTSCGLHEGVRAQQLSLAEWHKLYQKVAQL